MPRLPAVSGKEAVGAFGQAITMPLFFASNAIYPISLMPDWLKVIVTINPLSYTVDAMRSLLVTGDLSNIPLDMLAIIIATGSLLTISSLSFKRIIS